MSRTTPSGCSEAGACYLPVLAFSPEVMLSHAWKPCQSWRLTEQPNALHFQEYERLLWLFLNAEWGSASLQRQYYVKQRAPRGSSLGSSQQTPAHTQNSPFKPKGWYLWAESPPRCYLSGFPTGRKHVPSCAEWLMRSVLIFVSQVVNLLRSRGSGVTIKQLLKVETARISATTNVW